MARCVRHGILVIADGGQREGQVTGGADVVIAGRHGHRVNAPDAVMMVERAILVVLRRTRMRFLVPVLVRVASVVDGGRTFTGVLAREAGCLACQKAEHQEPGNEPAHQSAGICE